jgi:hypothetical protein
MFDGPVTASLRDFVEAKPQVTWLNIMQVLASLIRTMRSTKIDSSRMAKFVKCGWLRMR